MVVITGFPTPGEALAIVEAVSAYPRAGVYQCGSSSPAAAGVYVPRNHREPPRGGHVKRLSLLIMAILLFGPVLHAATQATPPPAMGSAAGGEQEVRKLLDQWLAAEAAADGDALARVISPRFLGMGPGGSQVTYDDLVPATGQDRPRAFVGASLGTTTVQVEGDTAIVLSALVFKGPEPGELRFSMVLKRRLPGQWQIISAHLGPRLAPAGDASLR